jgi:hypothetical protein
MSAMRATVPDQVAASTTESDNGRSGMMVARLEQLLANMSEDRDSEPERL